GTGSHPSQRGHDDYPNVALDRAGMTIFRDATFLAAGPARERSRSPDCKWCPIRRSYQNRRMLVEISKYVWTTSTRPWTFCLCLQGGRVFADFNIDSDGRVCLVRISFDGYGCCATEGKVARMPFDESHTLVNLVNTEDVNRDEIREILYRYFDQNQYVMWR